MMEILRTIMKSRIFMTLVVIVVSIVLYSLVRKVVNRRIKRSNMNSRQETYVKLLNNAFKYLFFIIVILYILQINGVNVTSIITGLGIVSAIVGLALQDYLKDVIMGINIISENYFMVGDVIKYNDVEGKVLSIGLRNTKIKDVATDDVLSITNRNIDKITKISRSLYINIPSKYEEDIRRVEKVIVDVCDTIEKFEHVSSCKYIGIGEFADSSIIYKLKVECEPEFKLPVKRSVLRTVKLVFDENNIEIPYTQIDIHSK